MSRDPNEYSNPMHLLTCLHEQSNSWMRGLLGLVDPKWWGLLAEFLDPNSIFRSSLVDENQSSDCGTGVSLDMIPIAVSSFSMQSMDTRSSYG